MTLILEGLKIIAKRSVITLSLLTSMKLTYALYYVIFPRGGLDKFLGPEREAYWRGGLN